MGIDSGDNRDNSFANIPSFPIKYMLIKHPWNNLHKTYIDNIFVHYWQKKFIFNFFP